MHRPFDNLSLSWSTWVLDLVVVARRDTAEGVIVLEVAGRDGSALPAWQPGAHIDLELANGLTRQYSLCGNPQNDTRWRIAVLREQPGRGGSAYIHESLRAGTRVKARGPRNHFNLLPSERYIFIAGGIGITPILPMIRACQRAGADWTLAYGGRGRASMSFLDELCGYGNRISVQPFDEVGHINLGALLDEPAANTLIYCCGPEPLLQAVEARCAHWPKGTLRMERFSPQPLAQPDASGEFEIQLGESGHVYVVPGGQSILDVLTAHGIDVLSSCLEGVCGSCATGLLSGAADHRDSVMTDEEKERGDRIMICCSRSKSGDRLVLDL